MKYRRMLRQRAAAAGTALAALAVAGGTAQSATAREPAAFPAARAAARSLAALDGVGATLRRDATIPGTSWVTDPATGRVVVTADRTVSGADWTRLSKVVDGLGGKAELRRTSGQFRLLIAGGDAITGPGGRCSLGFNVVKDAEPYFLTAGHCTDAISTWSDAAGNVIGQNERSSFPGNDFGLVRYTAEVDHPSEVDLYDGSAQPITDAAEATVGMRVTRSGSTSQVHDGRVTGLNATVNYAEGTVSGLIQTDVCAEPGDSGGPLFSGSEAVGLTSGGSGDCTSGGTTFFQPVTEALSATGTRVG